jgi:hypothetical protein
VATCLAYGAERFFQSVLEIIVKSRILFMALLAWLPLGATAQTRSCTQANLGQGWSDQRFATQSGAFSAVFDVTPSPAAESLVGLASGHQAVADQFAAVLRFSAAGRIEARNGATFSADKVVTYHAGMQYRVRLDVDLATHTYSAWVKTRGARALRPFVLIGKGLAFSAATAGLTQLDTLGLQVGSATPDFNRGDTSQVCRLKLQAVTPPPPPNADCTLIVPEAPLTAQGLATPYQLVATDPAKGECHQVNPDQSAFVQAAIFDPATAQISIYSPLVIDKGSTPAVDPVLPSLPRNAIVGLWFGYNGDNLTLGGRRSALSNGQCVNGVAGSVFGQFAYCNAPAFFDAASAAIRAGKLKVPALGMGTDGQDCPSSRSFWVVDQDQSDNVPTEYLALNGRTAQATAANLARLSGATKFGNPSDERLVSLVLDPALGCTPFKAANLADPGSMVPALALNELQAGLYQKQPVAVVPVQDPMVLVDGASSLEKLNLYRAGVGQPAARSVDQRAATAYCKSFRETAPARFQLDRAYFSAAKSPAPADANSLFTFLARRYVASYQILNCESLLNKPINVQLSTDANDVVVDVSFTP